jgi:hypothetical protein
VDVNGRMILTGLLTALLGVFSLTAPGMDRAPRVERLKDIPALDKPQPRLLEANQPSDRKPLPQDSPLDEFVESDSEETDEDDEHPLLTSSGELLQPFGPNPVRGVGEFHGCPARFAAAPLFLLRQRLLC